MSPDSSFNTAASFASNTNWQGYGGETTMSYLTQMLGLTVQNFVSAATGMAVLVALIRGFTRRQTARSAISGSTSCASTVYILLPLRWCWRCVLVSQGVVQTFAKFDTVTLVQPVTYERRRTASTGSRSRTTRATPSRRRRR